MEEKRIKVLTLGDMPLSTSGVGNQTKYVIEALLESGKFEVFSLGGAMKHPQYQLIKTDKWGDLWKILPVDQFGTKEMLRSVIWREKPDIVWFMTDPRFWGWLWEMDNEIRQNIPMVRTVAPDVETHYVPHAVDTEIFQKLDDEIVDKLREENKGPDGRSLSNRFVVLFNSRNARRKHSGTLVFWFKEFLERVGEDNAVLLMHTEPLDPNGPNLMQIVEDLDLNKGQVLFSRDKINEKNMATLYNLADVTVNISDAEGFGLSCLESLACETPVIGVRTGGLQDQLTDGKNVFGVMIEPSSQQIVGSQLVPYVMEDRINKQDFLNAMQKMYDAGRDGRAKIGQQAKKHVSKNFNFEDFNNSWVELMSSIYEKHGSWETRKDYQSWRSESL